MKSTLIGSVLFMAALSNVGLAGTIDDFERDSLGSSWTLQTPTHSELALTSDRAAGGSKSLSWIFHDVSTQNFNNEIVYKFSTAQDWSGATTITLYFATGSFAASTTGDITFYYMNNGVRVDSDIGYKGVASFSVGTSNSDFYEVTLTLGNYTRNKVTGIAFFVNGSYFSTGDYQFYIDNISVNTPVPESATCGTLAAAGMALLGRRRKRA